MIILSKADELRKKYMNNPPIGYSKKDVSRMSDDELLDMDYFLNEDISDIFGFPSSNSSILENVQFKCKNCGCIEYIPKNVVDSLDANFGGLDFPPTFSCEKCFIGTMFPVNYKSPRGVIYKFDK